MLKSVLAIAATAALSLPAAAVVQNDGLGQVQGLVTLSGTCSQFLMAGRDLTEGCNGAVLNTAYTGGKTSFMFAFRDGSIVSFYGRDTKAVGGKATMWVEKITIKDGVNATRPETAPATGRCDYTDPNAGPSTIICAATVAGRRFSARFISDGKPPVIERR